ncbi:MAG: sulfotransferase family 2 domain-containing protein [Desulfobacterales bacterium]|nr:sulfotransferase family 2 domain-containing protein [Desulfobacterales bacterium]
MKLYIVIRIPKSGSQSLRMMVEKSLPQSNHFKIPQLDIDKSIKRHLAEKFLAKRKLFTGLLRYRVISEKMFWKMISRRANDGDMLSGHMVYGKPQLSAWNLNYITLLRDPIDRTISEYYYSREGYLNRPRYRQMYHKGHAEVTGTSSFPEYLQYLCSNKERFSNPTTRFVTGVHTHKDPFSFMIKNYFHFGILERLDLFSNQLAEKLDFPSYEEWENKTRTKKDYKLTDIDRELLHDLLEKDIELYNKTKEYILTSK